MLSDALKVITDEKGKELIVHGTPMFPLGCYEEDVNTQPVSWHWHEDWEIIICSRGRVRVAVPAVIIDLRAGDGIFLGSNVIHEVAGDGPVGEIRSAVFHPRFIAGMDSVIWQKYLQPLSDGNVFLTLSQETDWQKECLDLFLSCWQTVIQEPPGYELLSRESLARFVLSVNRYVTSSQKELSPQARRENDRVKIMLRHIHAHYMESLTISQIAESASVSESECLRCFRHALHTSPGKYLKDFRLQKAAVLLSGTKERIGDIGAACGFLDAAYFTKQFREEKGCTPKEYRKAHQSETGENII